MNATDITNTATSNIVASECCDSDGALDMSVTIDLDNGRSLSGELTLVPSAYDGRYGSWGDADNWVGGSLLSDLESAFGYEGGPYSDEMRAALHQLALCAGKECDSR